MHNADAVAAATVDASALSSANDDEDDERPIAGNALDDDADVKASRSFPNIDSNDTDDASFLTTPGAKDPWRTADIDAAAATAAAAAVAAAAAASDSP
jgi:hypothetical protein